MQCHFRWTISNYANVALFSLEGLKREAKPQNHKHTPCLILILSKYGAGLRPERANGLHHYLFLSIPPLNPPPVANYINVSSYVC